MFPFINDGPTVAGGRTHPRRQLAALLALASLIVPAAAASQTDSQVSVREDNGVYTIAATFHVTQPARMVFAVLTDYEQIPRFMPDIQTSSVLERSEDRTVIEQEAIARFMVFSKRIHLVLEVHEEVGTIRFRDRCGKSFSHYEGVWKILEKNGQTVVAYELVAKPAFDVPKFVLGRLLKGDATEMIDKLQREITARTP